MKLKAISAFIFLVLLLSLSGCAKAPKDASSPEKDISSEFIGTSDPEMGSTPPLPEQIDTADKDVQIAHELLSEVGQVREHMAQGMILLYTGERQTVEGRNCLIFALGTDRDEQFVREYLYGVCDNLIYTYDAINDVWTVLDEKQ